MAATSAISPTSAMEHGDIRSAARPFKRDKDRVEKWSHGGRPKDIQLNFAEVTDKRSQPGKLRPQKQMSQLSDYDRPTGISKKSRPAFQSTDWGYESHDTKSRIHRKADHVTGPSSQAAPLSKSLLELAPHHTNNTNPPVRTRLEEGFLYSFDNHGPSPLGKASSVALGGLVEKAEEKWINEQTERIVKGEYEVLDEQGEVVKGRKKGSPRHNPVKDKMKVVVDGDDDFELV